MLNSRIRSYLNDRGISNEIIESQRLGFNGHEIVIPIFLDKPGSRIVFNKYRRDPDSDDGPKYKYDKGSYAMLYNRHVLKESDRIFITEGEFDAMVLLSNGMAAVSSTGGAGTFDIEWTKGMSGKEIYICFDADGPGVAGSAHVQSLIPTAKVIFLPQKMKGNDITDFFQQFNLAQFNKLIKDSQSYIVPQDPEELPSDKDGLNALLAQYRGLKEIYDRNWRDAHSRGWDEYHWRGLSKYIDDRIKKIEPRLKYVDVSPKKRSEYESAIAAAKAVPIQSFYNRFNRERKTKCLWHDENTASLHLYDTNGQNHLYCHGGCGKKDAIDLVQKIYNYDFVEAVKFLNDKYGS